MYELLSQQHTKNGISLNWASPLGLPLGRLYSRLSLNPCVLVCTVYLRSLTANPKLLS